MSFQPFAVFSLTPRRHRHSRRSQSCPISTPATWLSLQHEDHSSGMLIGNGYDHDFVNGQPPRGFACLVCNRTARLAQRSRCCQDIFCKRCVERLTLTVPNARCPNCGVALRYDHDAVANYYINRLNIYCDNRGIGCRWRGELRDADVHHDNCFYAVVPCQFRCGEILEKHNVRKHLLRNCPNREVDCPHCGEHGEHHFIHGDHERHCPGARIHCPNQGCTSNLKRKRMEDHRQECPKETVSCEYVDLGCKHVCLRKNMTKHSKQQAEAHLQLATWEMRRVEMLVESRGGIPQKHVLKLTSFSALKENGHLWQSQPFDTFRGGYRMLLKVYPQGNGKGEGTHVSVFLLPMAGDNDKFLQWPLTGEFFIEILNQEADESHHGYVVTFTANDAVHRGTSDSTQSGYGIQKFMSHRRLEKRDVLCHIQYLRNDSLYFRVSMAEYEPNTKPWLSEDGP